MKILQINSYESPGKRFHGLSITPLLKKYGIYSKHLVWLKDTHNPDVLTFREKLWRLVNRLLNKAEHLLSLQSVLYINGTRIIRMKAFKDADLIHLHIIYSGFFSIRDLPKITSLKPTIWTLHDPWALTGHCIHPFECERWKIGCGRCPDLQTPFAIKKDTTKFLFDYKKKYYNKAKLEIIVASRWMQNMVKLSPMFKDAKVHHLPFGIDLNFFSPKINNAKRLFNIEKDSIVISFRADHTNPYKGFSYIIEALHNIKTHHKICLLAISNSSSLLAQFSDKFQVINLDWSNDSEIVRDALLASDIFLMPSIAETFGMMAVEAMACGKPVIVFQDTALPEITFAPEVGIAVPTRDSDALAKAIQHLIDNPEEREERGKKGRMIAEKYYNVADYTESLVKIYREAVL